MTSQRQTQRWRRPSRQYFGYHFKYRRKTLLFALIKVITFICKWEILGCNSPLILKCPFSVFPAAMNTIKQKFLSSVLEN